MKTLPALFLALVSLSAFAQTPDVPVKRFLFKLSPQHFTQNTLKVGGEYFNKNFTHSFAIYASAVSGDKTEDYYYFSDYQYDGLGGELQYRKYISPLKLNTTKRGKEYYQGIYFAGFLQGGGYSADRYYGYDGYDPDNPDIPIWVVEYDYEESIKNLAFGFTLGVQRTLWKVLFIDVYVGGGFQLSEVTRTGLFPSRHEPYYYDPGISVPAYEGVLPKIGLQIGLGL